MVRNDKKKERNTENHESEASNELTDALAVLYVLPLEAFTGARNALAARLKRDDRADDADHVKALAKPSITAWAVNQLHWKHPAAFERLIAMGERFRQAQASLMAGKSVDIREPFDARRTALSELSRLAASILRDAGHDPGPDKISRIYTTLEAMSVRPSIPNAPDPGYLTSDLNPPGFDVLASLIPNAGTTAQADTPAPITSPKSATSMQQKTVRAGEEKRQAKIAVAKALLQEAERLLSESRAKAGDVTAALKKADDDSKNAEKHMDEAKQRFEKARAASEEAAQRAATLTADARQAEKALADAERAVEKASQEFRVLSEESM